MGKVRASLIRGGALLLAAPLLAGCFAIADLDRFHGPRGSTSGGGITGSASAIDEDLIVALGDAAPSKLELRVIDDDEKVLASAIVDTIGPADREVRVPELVPADGTAARLDILVHRGGASSALRIALDGVPRTGGALRVDLDDSLSR